MYWLTVIAVAYASVAVAFAVDIIARVLQVNYVPATHCYRKCHQLATVRLSVCLSVHLSSYLISSIGHIAAQYQCAHNMAIRFILLSFCTYFTTLFAPLNVPC